MKKVLIVGSGAREHALAQTFLKSSQVDQVIVAPGNDGMTDTGLKIVPIPVTDLVALRQLALDQQIDLTFVGSEDPLTLGIVDAFQQVGLAIFGPSQAAAQLEGSKSFAKDLLTKYNIPTARSKTVHSLSAAAVLPDIFGYPLVAKLDGLALGKGVSIIVDEQQYQDYLQNIFTKDPQATLVIEEFLKGVEFSIFSLVGKDGTVVHTPLAQDHKRRFDHDLGPNTGGMGAYSPLTWVSSAQKQMAIDQLVTPILSAMQSENTPFVGVLYTGVMWTKTGPKVIEYNVRFGDPEAQVVLPQYQGDFYTLIMNLLDGKVGQSDWQSQDIYLGVVLVAPGYPESPQAGAVVPTVAQVAPLTINYAGVKDGQAAGGRIATVVAHAQRTSLAQAEVYRKLNVIDTALAYRRDIGYQANINHL
ncbi:phosphoribosylamine--glycine ligase [Convivina praedatoris]|uniref:Phosphoribosylamine--glycine ligase n=1 Tax=Convivina praedatoris TaxID=2880963 RepID=A0ABN8H8R1_9LACO|nr:phosphoribosylamine--glycine ligase [Convivina sp. LMG 32447]CAH1851633.1 Phosphoribosylamine--glycine ligase [Convivina sp. LMG 32447]CAH1853687.1 Phosphoribosylamine--glycine ligase [Convivina sp. LMG 32447]CAH1854368.1 Phosphoribosylamine--glycine ligase [Convivina sp. LMG 32447]